MAGSGAPDVVLQSGHGANLSALTFSPNGRLLVSASEDSTLKLWDPNTGTEIRTLRGHSDIVTALAMSIDGTRIASASLDHTLRLWNAENGETLASFRGPAPTVYLLKISPDSHSLITAETVAAGSILRLWDIKSGRQIRVIKRDDAAVSHIFFSGPTMFVAEESGNDDSSGSLVTYNLLSGRQIQSRPVLLCGASEDGRWIALDRSTENSRRALIVDLANDKPLSALSGQVSRVVFSRNGEWLAYESLSGDTAVVRPTAGGRLRTIRGRGAEFSMLALSPDGRWLATTGADFSVHIWDVETGKLAHASSGQYTPTIIAFSPNGRHVAANGGGTDVGNALQVWDITRRSQVPAPRLKRPILGLAFSKDGAYLAVSAPSLEVFDLRTNDSLSKFECGPAPALVPAFSPNDKWIAATCGGAVTVWPVSGGAGFRLGEVADAQSGPLLFSSDGRLLAAPSANGLTLYDVAARRSVDSINTSDPVSAIAFSPAGDWLAFGLRLSGKSTSDKSLFLVDLHTNHTLWSFAAGPSVTALRFVREGHALVAAGDSLTVFDAGSGRPIHKLPIKVPGGSGAVLSPNADWLGAGSNSATLLWRLWF